MSLFGTRLKPRPPKLPFLTPACTQTRQEKPRLREASAQRYILWNRSNGDNGGALHAKQRWRARRGSSFEGIFIRSLVVASSCTRCKERDLWRKYAREVPASQRRHYSWHSGYRPFAQETSDLDSEEKVTKEPTDAKEDQFLGRHIPPREYGELAETYDSPSDLWELPPRNPASVGMPEKLLHMPLAPRLVLTPEQEARPPHAHRRLLPPEDKEHERALRHFNRLLRRPLGTSTHQIWNSYQRLQGPRPRYLTDVAIHWIFRHLTWVDFKDATSSQRYFSFLNEVLAQKIPVHYSDWNSSISFAARWIKHTTSEEVKTAIETWLRMENAGVQATIVTFNILFDAAIRAGRFALADTICDEIKERKFTLDRSFRTSMIYYAGLRRDGDAVRQAFRELVNAGEIVDTLVMNCVIVSLVRAGEGASAENAYLKMKHLHETKFGSPGPRNWRERKLRGIEMHQVAKQLRQDKEKHESSFFGGSFSSDSMKEEAQRRAPIHPDAHTYRILIRYYAYEAGNLDRCRELLSETKDGGWPVHGSVYLYLFTGFHLHGGHAYTAWNRRNLEQFWTEFIDASSPERLKKAEFLAKAEQQSAWGEGSPFFPDISADDGELVEEVLSHEERLPYYTPNLARVVISAFYKCAGRKRMLQVWAEIEDCWTDMPESHRSELQIHVNKLVADDSRYVE